MRVDDYLSVCMFQLKVDLDCNSVDEYIIETKEVNSQLEAAFSIIEKRKPDISLFPEMTYLRKYEKKYKEISKSRIIVAGSYYKNGINITVIFSNGKKYEVKMLCIRCRTNGKKGFIFTSRNIYEGRIKKT